MKIKSTKTISLIPPLGIRGLLFLLVCAFNIKAQTINTSFNIDNGTMPEIEEGIGLILKNNYIYILGLSRTNGVSPQNLGNILYIIDKDGELVSSSIQKQNNIAMFATYGHSFIINKNEFIYAADILDYTALPNTVHRGVITSYDSLLNINWQRMYYGDITIFRTLQKTAEGDYLVLGYTNNIGTADISVLLMKLDSVGNEKWTKVYGADNYNRGISMTILEDGNYLLGCNRRGSFDTKGMGWLIKTDTAGTIIWEKLIGDTAINNIGIHIFSDRYFHQRIDTIHFLPWEGFYAIETFGEFDENGEVLWTKKLKHKNDLILRNAIKLQDGGYLMVTDYVDMDLEQQINYLVKYNEEREIVWERYYIADNAIANNIIAVEEDADGYLVMAGGVLRPDSLMNSDIWLLKLNPDGCLDGGDCGEPIGILDLTIARETFALQVNPNPVQTTAKILVKNSANFWGETMQLSVYNLQGKKVYETSQKLRGQLPIFEIDCQEWQKGLYYAKASVKGKEYGNVKFVKN